jgi:hypothetical protein
MKEQSAGLLRYSCTILDEAIFLRVYGKLLYQYGTDSGREFGWGGTTVKR